MKNKLFVLALFAISLVKAAPPVEEGKTIFTTRCAGCHNINKMVVGPALAGVDQRHSIDWIVNFVHSSQTVIKKGDPAAVDLFNKFNHIQMPDHPDLTASNIKNVVEYIKTEASSVAPAKTATGDSSPKITHAKPLSFMNYGYMLIYFSLAAMLVATLLFAYQVKQYQRKVEASKK